MLCSLPWVPWVLGFLFLDAKTSQRCLLSQGHDKALKSSLLTAGFWGNLLWTWNQTLPFRAKSLLLSLLSKASFMVERKNPSAGVRALALWVLCRTRAGEMLLTLGPGGLLRALGSVCDSDLRQFWSYCSSFLGALQFSPFLTDFYCHILSVTSPTAAELWKWSKWKWVSKEVYSNYSELFGISTSDEVWGNFVFCRRSCVAHESKHRSS